MSESTADDHVRTWRTEALKKLIVKILFDAAVVGGRRSASYLNKLGMRESKIFLGYDVVDNQFFSDQVDQYRRRTQNTRRAPARQSFLYVGRMAPEKNLPGLLRAFANYRRQGGSWSLVLVGDGPLKKKIQADPAAKEVASATTFAGSKDIQGLVPHYAEASCFVLPSVREPWGLVVNEAMASGLPVIVSARCGCADDLVEDGMNGYIFDPDADASLVDALWRMERLDSMARSRMGAHSKALIQTHSLERWATAVKAAAATAGSSAA
jgi:glycosyltransferase involved in cell wall biosynthesis